MSSNSKFLQLAKARYSVRKYDNKAVEEQHLTAILESGRIAPTAANRQPDSLGVQFQPQVYDIIVRIVIIWFNIYKSKFSIKRYGIFH